MKITGIILLFFCFIAEATPVRFVAFGDAPYFLPEAKSMLSKLQTQIEQRHPDFVVHVGDLGKAYDVCHDAGVQAVFDILNDFDTPLVYTPGDNEWTDCHRKEAGQKDPLKQLEFIRKLFFAENQSLGKRKLRFEQQSQMKRFSEYSENLLWTKESVLFATLHIVGSNNNYSPKDPSKNKEFEQRKNATVSWLHHISLKSRSSKAKAVVLFFHADLRFGKSEDKRTGYNEIIEELTKFVKTVNVPVLAVHGDSHEFIIDSPLKHMTEQGLEWPLDNFLRLEVFGAPDVRGVEVVVDTEKSQPFSFLPLPQIPWEY